MNRLYFSQKIVNSGFWRQNEKNLAIRQDFKFSMMNVYPQKSSSAVGLSKNNQTPVIWRFYSSLSSFCIFFGRANTTKSYESFIHS